MKKTSCARFSGFKMIAIVLVQLDECVLAEVLSSGRVRWGLFRRATQAPKQVAGHDVGDHGKQHQEDRDPKNPTVVHSLPARRMRMISSCHAIKW
jgi:hypothetical protein